MGTVWEGYYKGVPLLGVPENPIDLWFVHFFFVSYSEFCIIVCQGFEITASSTRAPVESSIVYWLTGRWDMSLTCLYRGGMFKTKNLSQTQHVLLYGYFQK